MKKHILIVEDARDSQILLRAALEKRYNLIFTESLAQAEQHLKTIRFNLILLDVLLPDGSGFDFCSRLKNNPLTKGIPILFLTGQSQLENRVRGLTLGADDYILKPYDIEELLARIESHLRRHEQSLENTNHLYRSGMRIDILSQEAIMETPIGEKTLDLTRIEFKLLVHFLRHPGRVFSRSDLLKQVWGEGTHVSEHTVDTHISSLRKKIAGARFQLKAILRQGYCVEDDGISSKSVNA